MEKEEQNTNGERTRDESCTCNRPKQDRILKISPPQLPPFATSHSSSPPTSTRPLPLPLLSTSRVVHENTHNASPLRRHRSQDARTSQTKVTHSTCTLFTAKRLPCVWKACAPKHHVSAMSLPCLSLFSFSLAVARAHAHAHPCLFSITPHFRFDLSALLSRHKHTSN